MKGIVVVQTQDEYNAWLADKKPQYVNVTEAKEDAGCHLQHRLRTQSAAKPIATSIKIVKKRIEKYII
jgi:heme/copper-type cytochrome/quinol oxidase subunit 2